MIRLQVIIDKFWCVFMPHSVFLYCIAIFVTVAVHLQPTNWTINPSLKQLINTCMSSKVLRRGLIKSNCLELHKRAQTYNTLKQLSA